MSLVMEWVKVSKLYSLSQLFPRTITRRMQRTFLVQHQWKPSGRTQQCSFNGALQRYKVFPSSPGSTPNYRETWLLHSQNITLEDFWPELKPIVPAAWPASTCIQMIYRKFMIVVNIFLSTPVGSLPPCPGAILITEQAWDLENLLQRLFALVSLNIPLWEVFHVYWIL